VLPGGGGAEEPASLIVMGTVVDSVLFIGTQFSNLYTAVDMPAEAA
jgi:hypothetical protein